MSLIKNVKIGLVLDSSSFITSVQQAARSLDALTAAAVREQAAIKGVALPNLRAPTPFPSAVTATAGAPAPRAEVLASPTIVSATPAPVPETSTSAATAALEQLSSMAMLVGEKVRSAIQNGLAPLSSMASQFSGQFQHVGAVLIDISQRADHFMKALYHDMQLLVQSAGGIPIEKTRVWASEWRYVENIARNLGKTLGEGVDMKPKTSLPNFAPAIAGANGLTRALGPIAPAAHSAARGIGRIGAEMAVAFGLVGLVYKATQALTSFFSSGIRGARDLIESENKANVVFQKSASLVMQQADAMSKAFGFPKGALLDASATLGQLSKSAGQSVAASAQLSNVMVALAADVTSFANIPLEDTLAKIDSGLRGESLPLSSIGVLINEDTVKAEALALGFIKAGEKMDQSAKFAARASLIYKGLKTQSGDLERTFFSTANQTRAASGAIQNLATTVGTTLLPIVDRALAVVIQVVGQVGSAFEAIKPTVVSMVETVVSAVDTIGLVFRNLPLFGQLAWIKIQAGVYNTIAVLATLPENLSRIGAYIAGNWREIITDAVSAVWTVFQNLGTNIGELWHAITHVFETGEWSPNFRPLLDGFKATAAQLPELAKPEFITMAKEMQAVWGEIEKNEAARKGQKVPMPPRPELPKLVGGAEKKKGEDKYQGTAAAELGSREAASAIARFANKSAENASQKATARNTAQTAKHTMSMAQAMAEIMHRSGGDSRLSAYTF